MLKPIWTSLCLWFPVMVLCREVTTLFSFPITWQTQIQDCSQKRKRKKAHVLNDMHFRIHSQDLNSTSLFLAVCLSVFCFKVNRVFCLFYSFLCLSLPSFVLYLFLLSFPLISLSLLNPQRLWDYYSKDVSLFSIKKKRRGWGEGEEEKEEQGRKIKENEDGGGRGD